MKEKTNLNDIPLISVITPVYKVEKFLEKCIDSILAQSFKDFELIIVDDGSPDSCGEIADTYLKRDNRVKVIHKTNGGAPSARNAGIEIARGKYFYFPDSDDWIESDYLQDLYDLAIKTNAQLVISGYRMEYYENNKEQTYVVSVDEQNFNSQEKTRNSLHQYFDNMMMAVPWNKLYDASYIRGKQLLFPNVKWDDLHFNMEVIMDIERVAISPSSGYHFFRSRQGSETTIVFDKLLYEKRREQFEHILKVYHHWNIEDKEIMSVIYGYYAARLVQCVQEISISDSSGKKQRIASILKDDLNSKCLKQGKIKSKLLAIASFPMKHRSVFWSILMGKFIGYVKNSMPSLFYKLKSLSVNKGRKI